MALHVPALRRRRLASLALAAVIGLAIAAPGAAVAATTPVDAATLSANETAMVAAAERRPDRHGLVPVRVDARLMAIARARSDDMIANDYFSHTQPDGRNVFDILTAQHITWYNAGEIIAWNNVPDGRRRPAPPTASGSTRAGHYAIIVSPSYNYVGVGLAVDPDDRQEDVDRRLHQGSRTARPRGPRSTGRRSSPARRPRRATRSCRGRATTSASRS